MSRFYVSPGSIKDKKIYVERGESRHIIDVMRLRKGDLVDVFDGTGKVYEGLIASTDDKRVVIDVLKVTTPAKKHTTGISLAQAIPKRDKMDLIVQKTTELGVEQIFPIETARTVVKAKREKEQHKIERWQKIAVEASKQCGRTKLPKVKGIISFDSILNYIQEHDLTIMPCLSNKSIPFKSALANINKPKKVLAIIGPEGGFTEDEIAKAAAKGAVLISLGDLTLRSETAAITTLSILNYELQ